MESVSLKTNEGSGQKIKLIHTESERKNGDDCQNGNDRDHQHHTKMGPGEISAIDIIIVKRKNQKKNKADDGKRKQKAVPKIRPRAERFVLRWYRGLQSGGVGVGIRLVV